MSNCNLCTGETGGYARTYSSSQMMAAVSAGLRPPDSVIEAMSAALGTSKEDAQARWFQKVVTQAGDWSVCHTCSQGIEPYLPQSPAANDPASWQTPTQAPPYGAPQPGYYAPPPAPPRPASPYSIAPSYNAPYDPYAPAPKNDGFAIASLVLGLIPCTCFPSILAVIFGHISLSRIDSSPELYKGRTMAMWGLGLGYFFTVCNIIYGIIVASSSMR